MDTEETRRPFLAPRSAETPAIDISDHQIVPFPQPPDEADITIKVVDFSAGVVLGTVTGGGQTTGVWVQLTTLGGQKIRWSMSAREAEGTAKLIAKAAKRANRANSGPKS